MSIDDTTVTEGVRTGAATSVNRRTLMKTAAGAGVAAAAVGIVGAAPTTAAPRRSAELSHAAGAPVSGATEAASTAAAPLVVHVSDLAKGTLDVFTDGMRTQITDVDLARRIARAAN